ncbi:MAG TPA: hypothetical protein VJ841_00210 [Candidatus Saccharimonadales bacterium]|nr:hypothetical protein [Candidatus Saccharimonadales bacterium]
MDNLLAKLTRLHVEERSFTPDGSNNPISYSVAVLTYQIHGRDRTMELKISKDKSQILELADTIDRTL